MVFCAAVFGFARVFGAAVFDTEALESDAFCAGAVFFATTFLEAGFLGAGFCSPSSLAFSTFCERAEVARTGVSLSCGLGSV